MSDDIFEGKWPEGLKAGETYVFKCDDEERGREDRQFSVMISDVDSDVYLMAHDINLNCDHANPFPGIRCRTGIGGGKHYRTRQALLWLAQAIRLDNEELNS